MTVPSQIGPYLIEEVLRIGGTSIVYRAVDPMLGRHVAIKRLHPRLEDDPAAVARFRREALAAAKLKHPNVVVIHEAKVDAPPPYYIVMEFLEGGSLADRLDEGRRLSSAEALHTTTAVCEGLEHAHKRGLVHCDIKPGNIMFHADGRVAITDFGISRVVDQTTAVISDERSGTLEYMSPEQVRGEDLDRRSDVYSLGVVVYQMLTGRTPFRGAELLVVMRQILDDAPPSPRGLNPEIPLKVEAVLLRALTKVPAKRPRDAMGLHAELARAYRGNVWWPKVALAAAVLAIAVLIWVAVRGIPRPGGVPAAPHPPIRTRVPVSPDVTPGQARKEAAKPAAPPQPTPGAAVSTDDRAGSQPPRHGASSPTLPAEKSSTAPEVKAPVSEPPTAARGEPRPKPMVRNKRQKNTGAKKVQRAANIGEAGRAKKIGQEQMSGKRKGKSNEG